MRFAESIRDCSGRYPALEARSAARAAAARRPRAWRADPDRRSGRDRCARTALERELPVRPGPAGHGQDMARRRDRRRPPRRSGYRVGVTAQSHKVIHNLLGGDRARGRAAGYDVRGAEEVERDNEESYYDGDLIENETTIAPFTDPEVQLVAGTAWLFARPELDGTLDYLVIDEAGQVSLADAIAVGTSARNLILLGDPLQLAQVSQGTHPARLGQLGARAPARRRARRSPRIAASSSSRAGACTPTSASSSPTSSTRAGSHSHPTAAARSTSLGTGIRFLPVEHEGNRSSSPEEAERIAAEIGAMLGADVHRRGRGDAAARRDATSWSSRPTTPRCTSSAGAARRRADRHRRQVPGPAGAGRLLLDGDLERARTCPRNLAFLFSRNRLNVAISRAQCLAFLVCSPRLLEARCRSIEEMQLVNALCRLVEVAEAQAQA